MRRVLVIKLGAFGDFVLALPAMAAIRAREAGARITLLTTAPYAEFARASGYVDEIVLDERPAPFDLPGLWRLRRRLAGFDMVYDLQTSSRTRRYFQLAGRPPWSGIAPGCAYPHADPARNRQHTRERLAGQLAAAGIAALPDPDLSWARADVARFALPARFTLLVPGAAAGRPEKRWPAARFAALAAALPMPAVIVGTAGNGQGIAGLDLTGRTSLRELAAVTARAAAAIGNDTGPMHLAAALNVPSTVLFSAASDPALTAPRYPGGGWPQILRADRLADLPVAQVLASLP